MKHLAFGLLVTGLAFGTNAAHAAPSNTHAEVDYRADGSVQVGDQVFPTREAFHHSDLFRESGARCGSRDPEPVMQLLAAASDCGMNSTTINASYNDNRTLVIPVVFHVIKKTDGTGAISPALIQSQIDILNEDFNAMTGTPGAAGTNSKILFVLAKLDPMGNPTTGINVVTNNTYFADPGSSGQNAMKRALKWDPTRFFNIYTNNAGGGGILGYATFPAQEAGGPEDGVVLNWVYVGRNAPGGAPYNQGRTATHEVGHYLGLYHTFQSGCGSAGAPYTSGDIIGDTAREAQPNYGCTAVASGCGGGMSPIENYMDYSQDSCMTKFTVEQVNRMRCSVINYRWVNTPPTAAFTYTANGRDATFMNTTTDAESAATALKYAWNFGDGGMSTDQNPMHTYAAAGTYTVTLEVIDPGSGTNTKTLPVTVTATSAPDAGTGSGTGSGSGDGPDAGVGGGAGGDDEDPGTEPGGCCQAPGGAVSSLICSLPVLLVLGRRRRRARA